VAAFEERVATLEGGLGAVATASGLAAQLVTVLTLAQSGDQLVAARSLYGGTHTQFDVTLRRMGIDVTFVDFDDPAAVESAITDRTKALYGEIVGNPRADVLDVSAFADIAHAHGIPLIVDNTFASPYLCRPIEHGADIVVHSATKFISGHGTVIAGVIVESGTFPFDNGNFPLITEPSPAYHGLTFWENFREYAFLTRARSEVLRDVGAGLSPFNAFLLLIGLETLPLRMRQHAANAQAVAQFLATRDEVAWVSFPVFPDNPWTALAQKYLPEGPGAVFSFGLRGGYQACKTFIASVELASHLANVGDAKTLVIHPASTTHQQVPPEDRAAAGVGDDLIRISVGIETIDDILWDLDRALTATKEVAP
jgi:O-acetylhomoserine (thiol)-lyase